MHCLWHSVLGPRTASYNIVYCSNTIYTRITVALSSSDSLRLSGNVAQRSDGASTA
ncbi:hypothetical protein BCR37DRAFT_381837 [Protomyces lactucae-debilis]|uniref:Uncharacterized protein n=1 Tax=Protomyces lactucae-debilis TaxID=2754530 RepID=A0A1Y2F4Y8_PROLT|nr:uncharacterized protein BCR37DRAFT_381837 [Protomyces lactucae-debilis]ORY78970.1 hypothetical protein BCR37DRAFT_381837 [Protomyces lactucae-debilis]